jgi:hypothetical protein
MQFNSLLHILPSAGYMYVASHLAYTPRLENQKRNNCYTWSYYEIQNTVPHNLSPIFPPNHSSYLTYLAS